MDRELIYVLAELYFNALSSIDQIYKILLECTFIHKIFTSDTKLSFLFHKKFILILKPFVYSIKINQVVMSLTQPSNLQQTDTYNKQITILSHQQQAHIPNHQNHHPQITTKTFKRIHRQTKISYNTEEIIQLQTMVPMMQKKDFAYFSTIEDRFCYIVKVILSKFNIYKPFVEKTLRKVMDIIKTKYDALFEHAGEVYQKLYKLKKNIQYVINYEGVKGRAKCQKSETEDLYRIFIKQTEERSSKPIIKDEKKGRKVTISDYIGQSKCYLGQNGEAWHNVFFKTAQIIKKYDEHYDYRKREAQKQFAENIHKEILPNPACLGCEKHFLSSWNISNRQSKVKVALLGNLGQIKQNQKLIKEQICGMLNNKGGILLFNCKMSFLNVVANGTVIKQTQKIEIEETIKKYLADIKPSPKYGENVVLSFVPIKQSPLDNASRRGKKQRVFSRYFYVVRLVIKPFDGATTYFWNEQNPTFTVRFESILPEGKIQLKGKDIYQFIYNKNLEYSHEIMSLNQEQIVSYVKRKEFCFLKHKCVEPDAAEFKADVAQVYRNKELKNASLIIVKSMHYDKIKELFLKKHNIECQISSPFEEVKLKAAKTSGIIYHKVSGQDLIRAINNNPQFEFDKKQLIVIPITDYVKLPDRNQDDQMPVEDCQSLSKWLQKKYPQDKLEMIEYTPESGEKQYFIKSKTQESRLYMFMVLTNFQQKATFRNPSARNPSYNFEHHLKVVYPIGNQIQPSYSTKGL